MLLTAGIEEYVVNFQDTKLTVAGEHQRLGPQHIAAKQDAPPSAMPERNITCAYGSRWQL